nr:HAMP domain-containing sensor histidine kinase [Parapedobacter sp. ISTM3]
MSTAIRQKKIADIKTDFTNNITHELKTPLSSLKIITKRLEKKHGSEDFGRLLQTLERQHNRINGIIDQVLESSMTDRTDPVMKDVDIVMELHNYLDNLFIESHRVVRDIMGHGVMLNTDMQRLETILNNLTENAAKYSEKGKVITVRGYPEGNFYYIQVVDQGEGMEREHVSHAFDKFYRVPKENRHEVKGLGLGLYFCKQAATELGADLSVSSKVGEGSCFTLKLRIRQARYGVLEL